MTGEPPEVVVYLVLRLSSVEVYLKPLVWLHFYYFYYTSLGTFIRFNFIIDTLYNYLLSSNIYRYHLRLSGGPRRSAVVLGNVPLELDARDRLRGAASAAGMGP